jgi:1-acyl-sn-glycerol-3-phosphate acyltransferase
VAHARAGHGEIAEYQPRVALVGHRVSGRGGARIRRRIQAARSLRPKRPWQYRLASWIARNSWRYLGGGVQVQGLENVPEDGPFLVLANHESYLETMLVPAVMPRAAHVMAKSTQFGSRLTGWLMARLFAYPVRRFEIDPHAIRYTVDRMAEGYGIVIFIEGERTWDGSLQSARLGTVRLALNAGVPVIPCRVEGAYAAWPRWSSKAQRHPITVRFGRPIALPQVGGRTESEFGRAVDLIRAGIGPQTSLGE